MGTAAVRALRASDERALEHLLRGLSPRSLSARFLGTPDPTRAARSLATIGVGEVGFVAETAAHEVIGHAALYRLGPWTAEVAFVVADRWQGRGIAPMLLAALTDAAIRMGYSTLLAEVLPGNRPMLTVFERSGYPLELRDGPDVVSVRLALGADAWLPRAA